MLQRIIPDLDGSGKIDIGGISKRFSIRLSVDGSQWYAKNIENGLYLNKFGGLDSTLDYHFSYFKTKYEIYKIIEEKGL